MKCERKPFVLSAASVISHKAGIGAYITEKQINYSKHLEEANIDSKSTSEIRGKLFILSNRSMGEFHFQEISLFFLFDHFSL